VARVLVVPAGCRGRALAAAVRADGHAVRATSRREEARAEIEATGAEFFRGDPDRIGTLTASLDNTTILCWLLGSATGPPEQLSALHGSRLSMLLERTIDTTVRGIVYEAAGTVPAEMLERGAETVARACLFSEIPFRVLRADPADHDAWLGAARVAIDELLS
jgi:hypothetical protein